MWRLGPTLLPILTILPSLPDPSSCLAPALALANILGVNISFTPSSYWFLYKGNIQMSGFNFKTPSIYYLPRLFKEINFNVCFQPFLWLYFSLGEWFTDKRVRLYSVAIQRVVHIPTVIIGIEVDFVLF